MSRPMNGSAGRMVDWELVSRVGSRHHPRPKMILRSQLLDQAGFPHAFPSRDATDDALLGALGASAVIQVKQVHGARAVRADGAEGQEADAIVGQGAGVAVG